MATKKILTYPHKTLRKTAEVAKKFDEDLRQLGEDLQQTMRASQGIGLAATQIGATKRVVVVRALGDDDPPDEDIVAVNPEIIAFEGEVQSDEGCLSVPGVRETVRRAASVTVSMRRTDGSKQVLELSDHRAIVFQHEIDHLDGIMFFDHLSRLKRNALLRRYRSMQAKAAV